MCTSLSRQYFSILFGYTLYKYISYISLSFYLFLRIRKSIEKYCTAIDINSFLESEGILSIHYTGFTI